jgi:hypothetical protein
LVSSLLGTGCNFDIPAPSLLDSVDFVDLLNVLRDALLETASASGISLIYSFSGRLDPPVVYYQRVLLLWKDTFGGRLAISRDSQDASKIRGPLIRYFFAVTRPVMGSHTPSLQSLPDIVDRQKDFDDWYSAYKRLYDRTSDKTREEL